MVASSSMKWQHACSDMVSGNIPSTGFARTLFSVEESMIVNMDLPLMMFCTVMQNRLTQIGLFV
jgi:hypothetical protein